jgi:hypothetical protein
MDYVELHFDGKVIRALTNPVIVIGTSRCVFPEAGSRDALCSLIGKMVETINAEDTVAITLTFAGGGRVTIPLSPEARTGPEAAHFVPGWDQPIEVW